MGMIGISARSQRSTPRLRVVAISAATCLLVGVLGASVSAAGVPTANTAGKCSGTPITFGVITVKTSNNPTIPGDPHGGAAPVAAGKALNRDCTLGVPVKISVCDSHADPDAATACAHKGVEEHWVGWEGEGVSGAQTFPILSAAGIPEFGGVGFSPAELTSPLWYPYSGNIYSVLALITTAASANNPDPAKLIVTVLDNPAVATLTSLFKDGLEKAGGEYLGTVAVPASATDMSQYAAQVLSSGANALAPVLAGDQLSGMMQQLVQQGADFEHGLAVIEPSGATTAKDVEQLGASVKGIWNIHSTLVNDKKNPGVRQYIKELKAAKQPTKDTGVYRVYSDFNFEAWSWVHIMGELLADEPTKDAATLVKKLNTIGPIESPGMPTIDFAVNPFASDPLLGSLRIVNDQFAATRLDAKGQEVLVTDGFITIGEKFKAKKLR
jgi:ABC-type branched-subunit amino acid transport system substrate-binding protein